MKHMTEKKVWLITGAGRGMGVDIAQAALAAGNAVIATGRNSDAVAKAVGEADDLLVVQLDDQQIVCLADSLRHGVGVATGGDDGVPGGEGRLCDIHPHAAAGTGDKPHLLFSHVFHVLPLPMRECTCSRYSLGFSRVAWMDDPARFL